MHTCAPACVPVRDENVHVHKHFPYCWCLAQGRHVAQAATSYGCHIVAKCDCVHMHTCSVCYRPAGGGAGGGSRPHAGSPHWRPARGEHRYAVPPACFGCQRGFVAPLCDKKWGNAGFAATNIGRNSATPKLSPVVWYRRGARERERCKHVIIILLLYPSIQPPPSHPPCPHCPAPTSVTLHCCFLRTPTTLHAQFFTRLGLPKLRFKPAYNPYTEPSMEIFSYSEQLNKWMEVCGWMHAYGLTSQQCAAGLPLSFDHLPGTHAFQLHHRIAMHRTLNRIQPCAHSSWTR
jgi:hypothetical protein